MKQFDLIIASNNSHKVQEIKAILGEKFGNIYTLKDKGIDIDIVEDGATFVDNALTKARTICSMTGLCAIADDSGLCVDALNGAPGVFSARFAGEPCDDSANNRLLLSKLLGQTNRKAYYACAIVICFPDGRVLSAEGRCEGEILQEYKGDGGFGYDPLFFSQDLNLTFAQCSAKQKNAVSHRAKALDEILKSL